MIWFGSCIGSIARPFFYKTDQAPSYPPGIGSLLGANVVELIIFFVLRYAFKMENNTRKGSRVWRCRLAEPNGLARHDGQGNPKFCLYSLELYISALLRKAILARSLATEECKFQSSLGSTNK